MDTNSTMPSPWQPITMDGFNESDSDTDLEELEIALYSQIHYNDQDNALGETHTQLDCDISVQHTDASIPTKYLQERIYKTALQSTPLILNIPEITTQSADPKSNTEFTDHAILKSLFHKQDTGKDAYSNQVTKNTKQKQSRKNSKLDSSTEYIIIDSSDDVVKLKNTANNSNSETDVICLDDEEDDDIESDSDIIMLDGSISDDENMSINTHGVKRTESVADASNMSLEEVLETLSDSGWDIHDDDQHVYKARPSQRKRYYGFLDVRCNNCNEKGHLSKCCPKPKKKSMCFLCSETGHIAKRCPNWPCWNCKQPGHSSRECETGSTRHYECHRCYMVGHSKRECTETWRQFHITNKSDTDIRNPRSKWKVNKCHRTCYNCAQKGHYGHECTYEMMDRYKCPTNPHVTRYDNAADIRNHRKTSKKNQKNKSQAKSDKLGKEPRKKEKRKRNNHENEHGVSKKKKMEPKRNQTNENSRITKKKNRNMVYKEKKKLLRHKL